MRIFTGAVALLASILCTQAGATFAHFSKASCDDTTPSTPWYSYQAINQSGLCTNVGSGICAYFPDGKTPAEGGRQTRCAPRKQRDVGAEVLSVGIGAVTPGVTCRFFAGSDCKGTAFEAMPRHEYECFEAADGSRFRSFRCA